MSFARPLHVLVLSSLLVGGLARAEEKVRTVVVGLEGRRNVDEGLALAMSDVVHGETISDRTRLVFGRTDLQRVLEFESERQALGCQDDSCLAELASAMDADRIITGSIDKVGSSYFVVIAEIDAKKVEPLGRVQRTLPLDEDKLIIGIQEMTRELLKNHASRAPKPAPAPAKPVAATTTTTTTAPPPDADPATSDEPASDAPASAGFGSVEITSSPEGLEIVRDGAVVGRTPFTLVDVTPGTIPLAIRLEEGAALHYDVEVVADEVTSLDVAASTLDPSPTALEEFESSSSTNDWIGYGLVGSGVGACGVLTVLGVIVEIASIAGANTITGCSVLGCCVGCVACAGLSGGGLATLFFFGPEPPSALDVPVHRGVIRRGDATPVVVEVPAEGGGDPAPAATPTAPVEGEPAPESSSEAAAPPPPSMRF